MGQVIKLHATATAATSDPVASYIEASYAALERSPDFSRRPGQRELSEDICRALMSSTPIAAQAPTGTGKTLAYLIGSLAAAHLTTSAHPLSVVVATATVGLQTQIMQGDLPRLMAAGLVQLQDVTLAKGRSRYFCAQSAQSFVEQNHPDFQDDFFDEAANLDAQDARDALELLTAWSNREWSGDVDHYPKAAPKVWPALAANSDTCTAQRCEHYKSCPFFAARRDLGSAKVVVANHDLVLADLSMRKESKDPLLPGKSYIVVFDEAHHLPDKALDVGSAALEPHLLAGQLGACRHYGKLWLKHAETARALNKAKLVEADFDPSQLHSTFVAIERILRALPYEADAKQFRFVGGALPKSLSSELRLALVQCEQLSESFQNASKVLKTSKALQENERLSSVVNELLRLGANLGSMFSDMLKALELLTAPGRYVRWASSPAEDRLSLNICPLEGGDVLQELLWEDNVHRVALVSATLTDLNGFDRFKARCGLTDAWVTKEVPHVFPYEENTLYQVRMKRSPRQTERREFIDELKTALPASIDPTRATLVLFPSKALMHALEPHLRAKLGKDTVLMQGEQGIRGLVNQHKARVDSGLGSVLCGLATMAEGLDLPGHYCTQVAICAIPFTVPTTPVELEQKELLGKDYFELRAMPDALTKLTQMVGRLMRRETDRGCLTIFDNRLWTTRWGEKLLSALPPFQRKTLDVGQRPPKPAATSAQTVAPVLDFAAVLALRDAPAALAKQA